MLPNKSSNIMMLDSVGQSSGPQPLLSTSVSPATVNFGNKQRRPKMDSNKPSHKGNVPGSHHQHHHHQQQQHQSESKLYVMASIEPKDSLEITLEDAYNKLKQLICPNEQQQKPDNFTFNELSNYSNQSKAHYDEVCNALLYSILTDASNGPKCLRNLFLCNNISFNFNSGNQNNVNNELSSNISQSAASLASSTSYGVLISNLHSIITENYSRLQDTPRQQLVWLLRELVKARVAQCEKLMLQMLRNIQSGSLAEKNYWLAESLLDILSEPNTQSVTNGNDLSKQGSLWIYSNIELLTQTVYTYLRIIADHSQAAALNQLRQRETEFCIQVLRERWNDCILIGRDLVRLLQNLAKLNEFEQLWRDIVSAPQVLSPQFAQMGGLIHLMRQPTRRRCLISRLTIDMERKVYFIITSVKNGLQKRYLDWFQRQYLNTPESQALRVDLMRYILVVVHPTNEQLNSGLTPRWSLCGWLINSCTSQLESANLKLALYFDWLLYDAKKDNIMLIEPAILLMFNSIRPGIPMSSASASLTNQLFDFLCRISTNYHWPLKDQILNGIMQSFKDVIEKRVIPSIQTFFNEPQGSKFQQQSGLLDREVKNLIHATFGTFFQTLGLPAGQAPQITTPPAAQPTPQPLMTTSPKPSLAALTPENNNTNNNSSFSSFKRQIKTDSGSGDESSSHSFTSIDSTAADRTSFQSYFSSLKNTESPTVSEPDKTAPVKAESNDIVFKLDGAQFSSDDEDNSNGVPESKLDPIKQKWEPNQGSNSSSATVSASYLALQKQLKQFCLKPVKIFSIEETNSIIPSQNQFENHLALIQSDDLREKLEQFNEKVKESQSSDDSPVSTSYLHQMFKEILNLVHRDPELVNNFTSSLSDVAVSICLCLKIDFTNSLLPAQFYSSGMVQNFKSSKINLNVSDVDISQQHQHHVNMFSPNAHTLNLINESINQRTIFILFKELSMTQNQSTEREIYTQLLHDIYLKQNRIGYYFLFYIYVTSLRLNIDNKESSNIGSKFPSNEVISLMKIYFEFTKERQNEIRNDFKAKQQTNMSSDDQDASNNDSDSSSDAQSDKSSASEPEHSDSYSSELDISDINTPSIGESETVLGECYMQDLRLCQQDDPHLFCFLLPFICGPYMLQNYMCNNSELVYLLCSCIDAKQLKDLIATVQSQEISLVKHHVKNNTNKKNTRNNNNNNSAQNNRNNRRKTNTSRTSILNDEEKPMNKKRKRTTSNGSSKNDENKRNKPQSKKLKKSTKKKINKKSKNLMGKKNTFFNVLEASLLWESIEQIFFWQILNAHDEIDINYIVPLLSKLDAIQHAEAICYIFQMLKLTEPTFDLVKFLCKRRIDENMERALFVYWTRKSVSGETKLSQIFCKLLNKSATSQNSQQTTTLKKINLQSFTNNKKLTAEQQLEIANQQKSARTLNKVSNRVLNNQNNNTFITSLTKDEMPTLDQVLFYLNRLRSNNNCINFILKENILEILQKVYKKFCDDELKKKYSDLFTLADEFEADENESDENSDESSENDSDNDSDTVENTTRNKKQSKSTLKNKTKAKPGKQPSNKRAIRTSNSKLPNKKIKLRNQNSSDSNEDNDKNSDDTDENANDSDSNSSTENNKTYKNSRKK